MWKTFCRSKILKKSNLKKLFIEKWIFILFNHKRFLNKCFNQTQQINIVLWIGFSWTKIIYNRLFSNQCYHLLTINFLIYRAFNKKFAKNLDHK